MSNVALIAYTQAVAGQHTRPQSVTPTVIRQTSVVEHHLERAIMAKGELTAAQLCGFTGFGVALFMGLRLAGIEGCRPSPSNLTPREQQIRQFSDEYGIPIDDVRRAMLRADGWQID
jgi:hypothetical protein